MTQIKIKIKKTHTRIHTHTLFSFVRVQHLLLRHTITVSNSNRRTQAGGRLEQTIFGSLFTVFLRPEHLNNSCCICSNSNLCLKTINKSTVQIDIMEKKETLNTLRIRKTALRMVNDEMLIHNGRLKLRSVMCMAMRQKKSFKNL